MDTSSFIDWIIIGSGVYMLYCYFLMKLKGEIKENVMLSKNTLMKNCKDKEAYIRDASPKLLIFSIIVILCGAVGVFECNTGLLGNWYLLSMAVLLVATVWFSVQTSKLKEKYWS